MSILSNHLNFSHGFLGKNTRPGSNFYINRKEHQLAEDIILKNRILALEQLNIKAENICLVKQVHGNLALSVDKFFAHNQEPEADAIVTDKFNLPLAIVTADCTPILLADVKNYVIAAIHGGWRGARAGVINNTVIKMIEKGAKTDNIIAIIGPCIRQKSYEVTEEFFENFIAETASNNSFFINTTKDRYLFDLPSYVKNKLHKAGIKDIKDALLDTLTNSDKFFSYRKAKLDDIPYKENNIAIITMKR